MKALIAVAASRDFSETEFMEQKGNWKIPNGWQIKVGLLKQFTAQERHNVALNEAKYNADRIIFMDTDQIYPFEYIEMMLAHDEPVVSGLNVSRYYPFEFTCYKVTGEVANNGIVIPTYEAMEPPADQRIFECDLTGTGALMIDPSILNGISTPYFKDIFDSEGCVRLLPDDFYFGWLLYKAGIKIVVDQSIVVKHVAKILVSPYNARDLRRAWSAVNSVYGYWKDGKV